MKNETKLQILAEYTKRLGEFNELHNTFNEPQKKLIKAIFQDGYKRFFLRKGRKGGGTESILYPACRIAGTLNNRGCYIIGPTHATQREILWANQRLQNYVPKSWVASNREWDTRLILKNGSFVKVWGANDWKNMVGVEGDVFVFDELADHDPRAYKNCYPNIAARDALWFVVGAPPVEKVKSSFYYKLEQTIRKDPDWFFLQWPTWDNAEFLPGGRLWLEAEKKRYYDAGAWDEWEQRWEARYVIGGGGTVLSHFNPDMMHPKSQVLPHEVITAMISKDKHKLRWFQVFDPGYSTCFAVMFAVYNQFTSEIFLLDEIYETDRNKLSIDQIWPRVVERQVALYPDGNWKRVYDSAAPGFPQEVRSRWGRDISFQPTYKEKGDEDKFFRIINSALFTKRCWVSEKCEKGIIEMQDYATKDDGTYPDKDNHWMDNLRYLFKAANYSMNESQYSVTIKPDLTRGYSPQQDKAENRDKTDIMCHIDPDFNFNEDTWTFKD